MIQKCGDPRRLHPYPPLPPRGVAAFTPAASSPLASPVRCELSCVNLSSAHSGASSQGGPPGIRASVWARGVCRIGSNHFLACVCASARQSPCREQALYPPYIPLSFLCPRALVLSLFRIHVHVCMAIEAAFPLPVVHSSPLPRAPFSFFRVWSLSVLAACRQSRALFCRTLFGERSKSRPHCL